MLLETEPDTVTHETCNWDAHSSLLAEIFMIYCSFSKQMPK